MVRAPISAMPKVSITTSFLKDSSQVIFCTLSHPVAATLLIMNDGPSGGATAVAMTIVSDYTKIQTALDELRLNSPMEGLLAFRRLLVCVLLNIVGTTMMDD